MAKFLINTPLKTDAPTIVVDVSGPTGSPLAVGQHVFQLVVVDDSGNESKPSQFTVLVKDTQAPTAAISAPPEVSFGQSFTLDGSKSSDLPPGKIVTWIWSQVS